MTNWGLILLKAGARTKVLVASLSLCFFDIAFAEGQAAPVLSDPAASLLPIIANTALVVALIFGIAWLVRRGGVRNLGTSGRIEIVAARSIGTKERILLVSIGEQQLVLGATSTSINTLLVPEQPLIDAAAAPDESAFAKKLQTILKRESS